MNVPFPSGGVQMIDEVGRFLLVTADPMGSRGERLPAAHLVRDRLAAGRWPLFEGTRNRNAIVAGSYVAFYVGGKGPRAGMIVAVATVAKKTSSHGAVDPSKYRTDPPSFCLTLKDIQALDPGIDFRSRLPALECCPANMTTWGVVLMGGCRALSAGDWASLFEPPTV